MSFFFKGTFRFTAKLSGRNRHFLSTLCPPQASSLSISPTRVVHLVQWINLPWHTGIPSP